MKVTLGIIIGLLVIMCGLCVFSDPVEYKRSNVKLYLFEDFSGDGGGKSHPSVIFHKFKDSTGNVYNIQALETPDYSQGNVVSTDEETLNTMYQAGIKYQFYLKF